MVAMVTHTQDLICETWAGNEVTGLVIQLTNEWINEIKYVPNQNPNTDHMYFTHVHIHFFPVGSSFIILLCNNQNYESRFQEFKNPQTKYKVSRGCDVHFTIKKH